MALIQNKRDQYLLIVLILIIIGIGFIWWKNSQTEISSSTEQTSQKIEINFEFLKNASLDNLEPFSVVPEFGGEIPPQDPFLPK